MQDPRPAGAGDSLKTRPDGRPVRSECPSRDGRDDEETVAIYQRNGVSWVASIPAWGWRTGRWCQLARRSRPGADPGRSSDCIAHRTLTLPCGFWCQQRTRRRSKVARSPERR